MFLYTMHVYLMMFVCIVHVYFAHDFSIVIHANAFRFHAFSLGY